MRAFRFRPLFTAGLTVATFVVATVGAVRPPAGAALSPTVAPTFAMTPKRVLGFIRATFRSHRPPPPFVTYTLTRSQDTEQGYHDPVNSYKYHIWCRTSDRASLARLVFTGSYRGDAEFQRPAFNEARDPGPPTADVFEPAPAHPHPIEFVPTPEPTSSQTPLKVLGTVATLIEFDYDVESMTTEGDEVHLKLVPLRDPDRNRLRDIWADAKTYELRKLAATDLLFVDNKTTFGVLFTIVMGMVSGHLVVTDIRGVVGDGYQGDGQIVDYHFKDITFPATLPAWYFESKQYASHKPELPT